MLPIKSTSELFKQSSEDATPSNKANMTRLEARISAESVFIGNSFAAELLQYQLYYKFFYLYP
jgi:hypothetical protein